MEVWDTRVQKKLGSTIEQQGLSRLKRLQFSPFGKFLLGAIEDDLLLWESSAGRPLVKRLAHQATVSAVGFSPDERRIVSGTVEGSVQFWDTSTGAALLSRPLELRDSIWNLEFSRTGEEVLVTTDKATYLVDSQSGRIRASLATSSKPSMSVLNPDRRRLFLLSHGEGSIWDLRSGAQVARPLNFGSPLAMVEEPAFSADGQRLWIVGDHVTAWDVPIVPPRDTGLLTDLAEAVAGDRVDDGVLVPFTGRLDRLRRLREETASAPPGEPTASALVRWFLASLKSRASSPLSRAKAP